MPLRIAEEDIAGEGDEVGDDEVSAEEIVGAVKRAMAARRRAGGMVRRVPTGASTPYGQPVMAEKKQIDASLYQVMGLGFFVNAVAGPGVLTQPFLERFKTGRLILAETAPGNLVTGIFVGVRPQAANLAALPVLGFGAGAFETRIAFDAGEIGQPFTINCLTTVAAQTISGLAFGTVIKAN